MKTDFLTPKQQLFCNEYLTDFNATRAALRAGYSATTALNGQLMGLPKIKFYLQQHTQTAAKNAQVNGDRVIAELCKIAFGNLGHYFLPDGGLKPVQLLTDDEKAALWHVKTGPDGLVGVKMYNKLAALDKLAKHLGLFTPEVKVPEKEYVYLDDSALAEDDAFDAEAGTGLSDDVTDMRDDGDVPDDFVFLNEDDTPMFANGLPYGPMADVFRFDINDNEHLTLAKLKCYERVQAAAPAGSGLSTADFDVRKQLIDWVVNELHKDGVGKQSGYDDALLTARFALLRLFKKTDMECCEL